MMPAMETKRDPYVVENEHRMPGQWVLYAVTIPWTLTTYVLALLSLVCFMTRAPRFEGAGIFSLTWRDWVAKRWGYSTTLGRVIFWGPSHRDATHEIDERVEFHERVHIRQNEDFAMLAFVLGLTVAIGRWADGEVAAGFAWWLGLWWASGLFYLTNFLTAMLRYGWIGVYRDSEHERSASAQTDYWPNGTTWWEERDKRRVTQDKAF